MSAKLAVPPNITLMPLPSKAPELNPVENLWQFIRDNWLSNRIFRSYDDILGSRMRRMAAHRRSAMAHHDHRPPGMGTWVMSRENWYQTLKMVRKHEQARLPHRHPYRSVPGSESSQAPKR